METASKSKGHTRHVRNKVLEKFKDRLGYKKISQASDISWSTVQSIDQRCSQEAHGDSQQTGEIHRTTMHKSSLYVTVGRRKLLIKKHEKSHLQFARSHVGDTANVAEGYPVRWDENLTFWPKCKTLCGRKLTLHIIPNKPSPLSNTLVAASCSGVASLQQRQGTWSELMGRLMEPNTGQSWRKTCWSLQDLRLGQRFMLQQDVPKHKARATVEWLKQNIFMC